MEKNSRKIDGKTPFQQKWGITANELAEQDGVTPSAIHMRVLHWGTPWQRKAKPTQFERKYSKTILELAEELNLHPMSVQLREIKHGNVYWESDRPSPLRGKNMGGRHWKEWKNYKELPWLHPNHPDYVAWRAGDLWNQ
jgi:hypothetical protein